MLVTTFASGSSGNCLLVSMGGAHILIDAGISGRRIRTNLSLSGLVPSQLSAVLVTHAHSDHISGLAALAKFCDAPVLAPALVARDAARAAPQAAKLLREIPVDEEVSVGGVALRAFPTPHDTPQSVGYRLTGGGETFALATDLGCVTEEVLEGLSGASVALIEANHDVELLKNGPYPYHLKRRILSDRGHLSNEACAALAEILADRGAEYLILGHLSRENNRPELALRAVQAALEGTGVRAFVAGPDQRLTLSTEERLCAM